MLLILVILKQLLSSKIPPIKKFFINPLIKDSQLIILISDKDLKNNFLMMVI
jgi:ABC-type amino acid transport system permease subunit